MSAPAATLTKLLAWRPGGYLRASGALFGWLAVRTAAQAALFVLVARTLGAEGYGSLIAVMAIATLFAPLAGLGGQSLLVRDGARNPWHIPRYLGDALRLWAISVVPLCVLAFALCRLVLPPALPVWAIAAIVLADLAGTSLIELLARTWQTVQRMGGFGAAMAGLILLRLIVFCILLGIAPPGPAQWAGWYAAATSAYVALLAWALVQQFGRARASGTPLVRLAAAGLPFAFAGSALRVQAEANKPILARLDTLSGTGTFSAAQRVVDLLSVPLQALLETLTPRALGSASSARSVFTLGIPAMVLAAGGSFIILISAPWLPVLLGASYADSVEAARLLALLPLVLVIRSLLTTVLMARGLHHRFYGAYGLGAIVSVTATMVLVSAWGLHGAALAAYPAELTMIGVQTYFVAIHKVKAA